MLLLESSSAQIKTRTAKHLFFQQTTEVGPTIPSIWICLTGESKVPLVEAIAALDVEPDSLREAITKPTHAEKGGKDLSVARFRPRCIHFPVPSWNTELDVNHCPTYKKICLTKDGKFQEARLMLISLCNYY